MEIRSVNNRYLDISVKIPRLYLFAEDTLKSMVKESVARGKVDVYVTVDSSRSDNMSIALNGPLADAYMEVLRDAGQRYGLTNDITVTSLGRMPDVLTVERPEIDAEAFSRGLSGVLEKALAGYDEMRRREGEKLYQDILDRLSRIEALTAMAEERSPLTVAEYRNKLRIKMEEILANTAIDETRVLMEAAIFADRVAVSEEIIRLKSHVAQLRTLLRGGGPVGRKLDFILQELNREANTIGSKGNDMEMTKIVVELKAEIEKIREQAQNIE